MWTHLKHLRTGLILPLILLALACASVTTSFAANNPFITSVAPSAGPIQGGTVVRITGFNFRQNSTVTFGSVASTNVFVSGCGADGNCNIINVTTPPQAAGPVTVRVTNPSGTTAIAPQFFTYYAP